MVAGLDVPGGGSWLGINDHGLVAAVLNREGSLGPESGKRSRGELVLEALDHAESSEAAGALADLNPEAYRPFNLIIADPRNAYWLRHGGDREIRVHPIPVGLHMITAGELDDLGQPRIEQFLPQFRAVAEPHPANGDWDEWIALLQRRDGASDGRRSAAAMNLDAIELAGQDFGTVSASLIAVPAYPGFQQRPTFLHAEGPPDRAAFVAVDLDPDETRTY